jgi:hypothetical protein
MQMKVVAFAGTVSSTALTMAPSTTAKVDVTTAVSGDFAGEVKLICKSSATIECSASPVQGNVSPGNPLQSVLTLHATSSADVRGRGPGIFLALFLPLSMLAVAGWRRKWALFPLLISAVGCLFLSCGGGGGSGGGPPPIDRTYTVQVQMQTARGADTVVVDLAKLTITVHH